ncbi:NHL domain-containing protein [Euphorbia peplus]|nr:NHL domain-containing protein [Euphorbia peplus]
MFVNLRNNYSLHQPLHTTIEIFVVFYLLPMASRLSCFPPAFFLILFTLPWTHVSAALILEEGYTVTTVIDGRQLKLNPHALVSRSRSSDLVILDSSRSAFFTLRFPISLESTVNPLSGNGAGISDGALDTAQFNKPKNFAVDAKGNIYVADRINGIIRKITNSGVTTIAGGYSKSTGRQDGPAQNATFSSDFEVAFVPQECALLISDHGNQLIRHIGLKPEDCTTASQSGLGMVSYWVLGLGLFFSCLLGITIGFAIRSYITPRTGRLYSSWIERDMEALPNQSGETSTDVLLRHEKRSC